MVCEDGIAKICLVVSVGNSDVSDDEITCDAAVDQHVEGGDIEL